MITARWEDPKTARLTLEIDLTDEELAEFTALIGQTASVGAMPSLYETLYNRVRARGVEDLYEACVDELG